MMKKRGIRTVQATWLVALSVISMSQYGMAQEIIVDNLSADTRKTGSWYASNGANPYLGHSLYSNNGSRFYWNAEVPVSGDYDVYAWWTYRPNRSNNVPYFIRRGVPAPIQVNVDQSDPDLGGQWNLLGRFSFDRQVNVSVASYNGQASADAIRLVLAGIGSLPFEEVDILVGTQRLGDSLPVWETTIQVREDQLGGATSAAVEFVAVNVWEGASSNIVVNGRKYALPASEPLDLADIALRGKSVIPIPVGLLRSGDNTIVIEAGPIDNAANLYDDFYIADVTLVLSR